MYLIGAAGTPPRLRVTTTKQNKQQKSHSQLATPPPPPPPSTLHSQPIATLINPEQRQATEEWEGPACEPDGGGGGCEVGVIGGWRMTGWGGEQWPGGGSGGPPNKTKTEKNNKKKRKVEERKTRLVHPGAASVQRIFGANEPRPPPCPEPSHRSANPEETSLFFFFVFFYFSVVF